MNQKKYNYYVEVVKPAYLNGMSAYECAHKFELSEQTIRTYLKRDGLCTELGSFDFVCARYGTTKEEVVDYYLDGHSTLECQKKFGMDTRALNIYFKKQGIFRGITRHRAKVEIGLKRNSLTVIEDISDPVGDVKVKLLCDCGGIIEALYSRFLYVNKPKTCGCVGKQERAELVGQRFGRLVIESFYDIQNEKARWLAKCDCGSTTIATTGSLHNGCTKSCGCLVLETITKHGHAARGKTDLTYTSFQAMLQRCMNPNTRHFEDYGGRGITVCERWQGEEGFINFLADMGERSSKHLSLDRYPNVNGNYEPGNCRWATWAQQSMNKRNTSKSVNHPEHVKWKKKLFSTINNAINVFKEFGNSNSPQFKEFVGCTFSEFYVYMENQFTDGMTWNNHGKGIGKWNIEHIFPVNNFDLSIEEDRYRCFHYSNLQPMWAPDNLSKVKKDNKLYVSV